MEYQQSRLPAMVAQILRDRIISGKLKDGDTLPRQEALLAEFGVSKPSLREALRILESQGLVTIRRGNQGGAIVHVPKEDGAAYMVGLLLQFRCASYADLATALGYIEPSCFAQLASRRDRSEAVDRLRGLHAELTTTFDKPVEFARRSRQFHQEVIRSCGNETLIVVAGVLESLWARNDERWPRRSAESRTFPDADARRCTISEHQQLIDLVHSGLVADVERLTREHLHSSASCSVGEASDSIIDSAWEGLESIDW